MTNKKLELFETLLKLNLTLDIFPGRVHFHNIIVSVPWTWSPRECHYNVTETPAIPGDQEDVLITETGLSGHVETHSRRVGTWDSRAWTRVILPRSLVTSNNVTRMLDLWTEYR